MLGRTRSPIALDVGEHSVKVVQLERRGKKLRLQEARTCEIMPSTDAEGRRRCVLAAARAVLDAGAFHGRVAFLALRLADVTTRHVRIPADQLSQAAQLLANEIRSHATPANGDFSACSIPVADLVERGVQKREFLCWIAPSRLVQEQIELSEALGLTPLAIDLDACAQTRPFVHNAVDSSFLNLDIGFHCSRITVVKSGVPVVMRTAPVGSSEMILALKGKLQLDLDAIRDLAAAERDGKDVEAAVTTALGGPLDLVLARVGDCVRYCGSLFRGKAVSSLRVIGGIAALPGLVGYLGRRLGMKAELGDPIAAMGLDTGTVAPPTYPGAYATALGLCLRGIDA